MGEVQENFIKPLARQFHLPKGATDDPAGWEKAYIEELGFYSDTVLQYAAKRLIANRETRSFPLVAECISACRETFSKFSEPESKHRTTAELVAENAHLGRLNTIAAEGDMDRAARLCIILMKSSQTGNYDWSKVDSAVMYLVNKKLGLIDEDELNTELET